MYRDLSEDVPVGQDDVDERGRMLPWTGLLVTTAPNLDTCLKEFRRTVPVRVYMDTGRVDEQTDVEGRGLSDDVLVDRDDTSTCGLSYRSGHHRGQRVFLSVCRRVGQHGTGCRPDRPR